MTQPMASMTVLAFALACSGVVSWSWVRAQQPAATGDVPASAEANPIDARPQPQPLSRSLDEEEIAQALQFAETSMPNFYNLWRRLPPERQRRMPPRMQWGFRLMFDAKKVGDDRLYDMLARQMILRDEFMALRREYRRSGQSEEVRRELLAKVEEIVQAGIQQRELRIEKLEGMLASEKLKLERDRQDPKRLVDEQFRRLDEETSQFVTFVRRFQPLGTGAFPGFPMPATVPTTQPHLDAGSQ